MKRAIVVTGDSGSLGSAICEAISVDPECVVIGISRRENDNVERLKSQLNDRFVHLSIDLGDLDRLESDFKERVYSQYQIVGLVNNSASAYDDIATNLQLDPLRQMFSVNVYAPMVLSKMVIRNMLLNETEGSLVHISSVSVHTGYKGLSMYAATKGALEAYSLNVAREWGPRGIRSNCVAAGFMDTQMTSTLDDSQKERILKRNSMKTLLDPNEVAQTVRFLLSPESSAMTGTVIRADKGTV